VTRKAFLPASAAEGRSTRDQEGLLARLGRRWPFEPEADEQVRAQPHQLPADVEQQEVVGQHQDQHGEDEQVEQGEKAGIALVLSHVTDGVDVDQETHSGDYQSHQGGELIHQKRSFYSEVTHCDPGEQGDCVSVLLP